jgi:predicted RNA-binding protein with PUA-like domain
MATFVLKTEPSEYSFSDLVREKRAMWSGVSNAAACAHLRSMRPGDEAYIYHTGSEKAIVGLAQVVSTAYGDPGQLKDGKPALNAKGELAAPVVDVSAVRAVGPLPLAVLKADERFANCPLVTQGRLSVVPLKASEVKALLQLVAQASRL